MEYEIIRTARKTVAIQILPGGRVVVRCPRRMSAEAVRAFVESKRPWVEKHLASLGSGLPVFSDVELDALVRRAKQVIPGRVAYFAPLVGVRYGRITVRKQRSRWGSCSGKGNLNFNCLLMLVPEDVLDYVVVHELCHRKHMNHSDKFWAEVERVLPDYRERRVWLKHNGSTLVARLP